MKVLIMAAGVGSRISRHLHGQPKCCVDIAGKPLIRRTVELLIQKNITDITIVTGYQDRYIMDALEGLSYARFYNPFYRVTNSVASVWFAKSVLNDDDDIMIMNGDVFIEARILETVLQETRSPVMIADSSRIKEADYRFSWKNQKLEKFGKELSDDETTGEYVGIGLLRKKDVPTFKNSIEQAVKLDDYACWWEDIIYRNIHSEKDVYIRDISEMFWAEVDYIEDYERIKAYFNEHKTK